MAIDWAPSVENVASHLPMRTVDKNGRRQGTFDDDTTPNRNEVVELAETAAADVLMAVGGSMPSQLEAAARRVAALFAACSVELTYFPEQIATDRSPYDRLKVLADEALARLVSQATELVAPGDASTSATGYPSFYFPSALGAAGDALW